MGKFKKGDRIIVDEDDFCGCYKAGDEFEVIHCDGGVVTFIDRDGDKRYLRHDRIQPVPVAEATGTAAGSAQDDKPKFKVGDRVRYKNPVYGEATVVRVESDGLVVVDTHCDFGICTEAPENIEPVAVAGQQQPVAEADEPANDNSSTSGFTVPLCAYEDEPGWYVTELGRAYADGYAAGLRAGSEEASDKAAAAHCFRDDVDLVVLDCLKRFKQRGLLAA